MPPTKKKDSQLAIEILPDGSVVQEAKKLDAAVINTWDSSKASLILDKLVTSSFSIDSGYLPNTLLSWRVAQGSEQYVLAMPPGIYQVQIGKHEGDKTAEVFYVAQPWKIIIGDYRNNNFVGARLFYAADSPFDSEDIPLYHANVPNLNCYGYGGTSLGWICLYHTKDTTKFTMAQKASYIAMRVTSGEAFNTGNMPGTDGLKMYRENNPSVDLHIPSKWEARTKKEGFEWILDPKVLVPILVQDQYNQDAHYPGGIPLTLSMAMRGRYQAYYSDPLPYKPFNPLPPVVLKTTPPPNPNLHNHLVSALSGIVPSTSKLKAEAVQPEEVHHPKVPAVLLLQSLQTVLQNLKVRASQNQLQPKKPSNSSDLFIHSCHFCTKETHEPIEVLYKNVSYHSCTGCYSKFFQSCYSCKNIIHLECDTHYIDKDISKTGVIKSNKYYCQKCSENLQVCNLGNCNTIFMPEGPQSKYSKYYIDSVELHLCNKHPELHNCKKCKSPLKPFNKSGTADIIYDKLDQTGIEYSYCSSCIPEDKEYEMCIHCYRKFLFSKTEFNLSKLTIAHKTSEINVPGIKKKISSFLYPQDLTLGKWSQDYLNELSNYSVYSLGTNNAQVIQYYPTKHISYLCNGKNSKFHFCNGCMGLFSSENLMFLEPFDFVPYCHDCLSICSYCGESRPIYDPEKNYCIFCSNFHNNTIDTLNETIAEPEPEEDPTKLHFDYTELKTLQDKINHHLTEMWSS